MPICIECRYPVHQLYTTYSKADDRSLGKGVRLVQCPRCNRFADKYVEHDYVILFIDLVLIKPQVYRHLLFNRLGREDDRFDPSIIRLATLLLLFDVYLTWAGFEKQSFRPNNLDAGDARPAALPAAAEGDVGTPMLPSVAPAEYSLPFGQLAAKPIFTQYLFFVVLCLTESFLFHITIRLLSRFVLSHQRPNSVSSALFVSSCTKLFPILMVIWDYDVPAAAESVGWAVVVNNIEALRILLDTGYFMAAFLAASGALARFLGGWCVLKTAGLDQAVGVWTRGNWSLELLDIGRWTSYLTG